LTQPAPLQVSLGGLCPRCGAKTLFAGFASFAPECRACGLQFQAFNVGDGPAAFLTLGIGALVALRYSKGGLLALEYRHRASEVRILGNE
jgi:uncharacterized protein (DUF983 family)